MWHNGKSFVRRSSTDRKPVRRKSFFRPALIVVLLACFAALEAASAVENYSHRHGGSHTHCCPACHPGHLAVALVVAHLKVAPPAVTEHTPWHEDDRVSAETLATSSLSRAPPA